MLHRLGISLEEQGRKEEAAKCFAAAKELDPSVGKAKDNSKRARP
jgi:hypothetical protein